MTNRLIERIIFYFQQQSRFVYLKMFTTFTGNLMVHSFSMIFNSSNTRITPYNLICFALFLRYLLNCMHIVR